MQNLAIIIGVRPHYVKACGINKLLLGSSIEPFFVDVHQHYDHCLRGVFTEQIADDKHFHLLSCLMAEHNSVNEFARQVVEIGSWLNSDIGKKMKAVVVLGDANPALSGAIAANRLGIPVVHIEAGVRRILSEKEHWNSLLADHLSSLRYCYTDKNLKNLEVEGLKQNSIVVGDILSRWTIEKAANLQPAPYSNYCLVSIHRPQNCSESKLAEICKALQSLNKKVLWIMHPRTEPFSDIINVGLKNVALIPPQSHDSILTYLKSADLVFTDSGGLIREGVLLEKPVIVCHEQGMWEELVRCGAIARADVSVESILSAINFIKNSDCHIGKNLFIKNNGDVLFLQSLTDFLNSL